MITNVKNMEQNVKNMEQNVKNMEQNVKNMEQNDNKIIVFDLDETLGYFVEFGLFWECLNNYLQYNTENKELTDIEFNSLLDLYPEFIRPNMYTILQYIKSKIHTNECNKIMIYTNNTGPNSWSDNIKNYLETKIKHKLFGQIIRAFKINGKYVELLRTTHKKTHCDLIRCTKLPSNTQFCFMDDTYYPGMCNENIFYINLKSYIYKLPFEILIQRFLNSSNKININIINNITDKPGFVKFMLESLNEYDYKYEKKSEIEYDMDKIITKKILYHIDNFLKGEQKNHVVFVNNNVNNNTKSHSRKNMNIYSNVINTNINNNRKRNSYKNHKKYRTKKYSKLLLINDNFI
jgi:hypothetical protein